MTKSYTNRVTHLTSWTDWWNKCGCRCTWVLVLVLCECVGVWGGLEKEESRSEWRHFVWFSVQQGTIWELQSLCKGQGRQSSNYCVGVCSRCSGISSNADSSLLPSFRPKYLWSTYLVRKRIIGIMHCEGQLWHISYIISCSYLSPEKVLSHLSLFPHCVIR